MTTLSRGARAAILCIAAASAAAAAQEGIPFECPDGAALADTWEHPRIGGVAAMLCRHDPFPKWSESLWVTVAGRDGTRSARVPLYGTGVERLEWLRCPGSRPAAYLADVTHMGTVRDALLAVGPDASAALSGERVHAPGTWAPRAVGCPPPEIVDPLPLPGIVNAASLEPPAPGQGFAPGSLLVLRGADLAEETRSAETYLFAPDQSLPFELAGVTVHVGGRPAPLAHVSPRSVTFQLPFEAAPPFADLIATGPRSRRLAQRIPVSPAQPGIDPGRVSEGATIAVFPGPGRSRLLELFCTGLGAVDPPGRTGRAGLRDPRQRVRGRTQAWVDGREVGVTHSALVTFAAGTYAVALEFPEPLKPGKHTVQIAVDGIRSNIVEFQAR